MFCSCGFLCWEFIFFCWLLAGHENTVEMAIYESYDFPTTSSDLDLCVWAMENLGEQGC